MVAHDRVIVCVFRDAALYVYRPCISMSSSSVQAKFHCWEISLSSSRVAGFITGALYSSTIIMILVVVVVVVIHNQSIN